MISVGGGGSLMNVDEIEAYTSNGRGAFEEFCNTVLERKRVEREESAKAAALRYRSELRGEVEMIIRNYK